MYSQVIMKNEKRKVQGVRSGATMHDVVRVSTRSRDLVGFEQGVSRWRGMGARGWVWCGWFARVRMYM